MRIDYFSGGHDLMSERVLILFVTEEVVVAHYHQIERQSETDELSRDDSIEVTFAFDLIENDQNIEVTIILSLVTGYGTEDDDDLRIGSFYNPMYSFVHRRIIKRRIPSWRNHTFICI